MGYCNFFTVVNSFVELSQYLLTKHEKDELFLLSERLTQDPLANYFGQRRASGHRSENATVKQCLQNSNALRVQKSSALNPVRGNCSRKDNCLEMRRSLLMMISIHHYLNENGQARTLN